MATSIEEKDSVSGAVGNKTNCNNCKEEGINKAARSFCHECDLALCGICERMHRKFASSHEIEYIDEVSDVDKAQPAVLCSVHTRQAAVLFCQDHESLICSACQEGSHSACSVQTIAEACDKTDVSKEICEALDKLMELQGKIEKLRREKQLKLTTYRTNFEERKDNIKTLRKKFNNMFDRYEGEMESKEATSVNSLSSSIRKYDNLFDKVKAEIKWLEDKRDKETSFQQLITSKSMSKRINYELGEICGMTTSYDMTITEDKTLPLLLDRLSKLVHQEVTDSEEVLDEDAECHPKKKSFLSIISCTDIKEVEPRVQSDKEPPIITGCCWLPDGNGVILCDYHSSNKNLKIVDRDMNIKFTAVCSSDPYDVDFIDEKSAVVTLPCTKEIQFLEIKPGFKFKGKKDVKLSCYGVSVHDKSIFVCVDALSIKGVKVMTLTGDDVTFIPHLGPGSPRKLCLNSDGKIYYTSGSGKDLYINCITKDGHGIFSVSSKDLDYLAGITSDSEGNVLVCDENKKLVQVISSAGVCGNIVLTDNGYEPRAMCINKSHDILAIAWRKVSSSPYSSKFTLHKLEYT